ncbi:MAG TPA: hypothetical protein ENI77_03795 [Nitrospirae bacterium]|nr:hypothetical protein [Nitrospirota bacterium]
MKKTKILVSMVFAVVLALSAFTVSTVYAGALGNGSAITDTLQIGVITSLGDRKLTIKTEFEKTPKSYSLELLPECYVMTAMRGHFKKFKELKKGDLIAAYGWYKGGKWNARRIDILDRNDYLIKRLASDAKSGSYYKHER